MFAKRLKQLRLEKGLTLRDVADHFKMSHSTLSKYENGKRHPDMVMIIKLSEFFDVSVDYLLGESLTRYSDEIVYVHRAGNRLVLADENIPFELLTQASDLPPKAKEELAQFVEFLRHKYKT